MAVRLDPNPVASHGLQRRGRPAPAPVPGAQRGGGGGAREVREGPGGPAGQPVHGGPEALRPHADNARHGEPLRVLPEDLRSGQQLLIIKLKVCLDQVRLWDAQGQPLPEMGDLTNRECKVRTELKQVWMMSGQCGLLVEVTDLMLKEEEPQRCPF